MSDTDFIITLEKFGQGASPLAHIDSNTFEGGAGHYSDATIDLVSDPHFLMQSPGLSSLTNGTQSGVVTELIRHVLDQPVDATTTYAVGTSKLFKLTSTTVSSGGTPSWPQAITTMTSGECVIRLGTSLYVFYNKTAGGDIAQVTIASGAIDNDWGSSTDAALEKAPHPAAVKEDVLVFGNGQYVGVYVDGVSLDVKKLDFGAGAEVADIVFYANVWYIAVNYGEGRRGQVYLYDGSAVSNILSDEVGIGPQEIGFLQVLNGVVFVAYRDNTTGYFSIGWLSGRQLKPLKYFTGSLPDHRQKTIYKNTVLFASSGDVWSCGAPTPELPIQISKHCDGGYATLGGLAAPFGTPLIASTDGGTGFRLAKFSGYSITSDWESVSVDLTNGRMLGRIHTMIVATKPVNGSNALADVSILGNQESTNDRDQTVAFRVSGDGETRHVFRSIDMQPVTDCKVRVDYSSGDQNDTVKIRKIQLLGNFVER